MEILIFKHDSSNFSLFDSRFETKVETFLTNILDQFNKIIIPTNII